MPIENEVLTTVTTQILKNVSKVHDELRGSYKIHPPEITVHCPENLQNYSVAFEVKGGYIPPKIKFPYGKPHRIKLKPLRGLEDLSDAINIVEKGFELNTRKMENHDVFILDVEYQINSHNYLSSLVDRHSAKENPSEEDNEYWMHAEMKHPSVFKTKYGKLDLQDIDFNVDVGISRDINTVVPEEFRKELETGTKLLKETNPREIHRLTQERIRAMRARGKKKTAIECVNDLQELFIPNTFSKYIDVEQEFRYENSLKGGKVHDSVPWNLTWPKSMKVISRTDLNLNQFAAQGVVKYKRKDFVNEIGKILGKS
ncbi:hypothetical protein [Methanohalophilus euhalobius]|jgi:hypothetical protein|uniref:Uncharacterized protein n=1 Tax=Methanohalophilus euhalobius TaxID=51203 RepID=A0A314ZLP9_9EURY|nr:hypothetical protein [Methanohalophilus euhalobius]PQV42066.1 hypothetical protein B0H22_1093 [Methanohalophilus euhalobius]RNI12272.1 hypothetical protein EDD83_01540 [Methanohalophilus euhalobius]